jgi:predicted GNAT family N-acyltransferase
VYGKLSGVEISPVGTQPDVAGYEIRRVRTSAELEAAMALRYDVFCAEQGVPVSEERDGRDHLGLHLIAVGPDDNVLGTCRLVFVGSTVQFSRLAVAQQARRRGIATALLQSADAETRVGGANRLVLHAQNSRPTRGRCTSAPGTSPAAGSSRRRGSSTSRWRRSSERSGIADRPAER